MNKELPRQLGLKDAVGILVGNVIGSAIFIVAAKMTAYVHTPAMVLAIWIVGGIISFMGGVTFAELGTRYPEAGGMYTYLREAFGPLLAFLYGWSLFLIIQTGAIAAVAVAFARYFTVLTQVPASWGNGIAIALIAVLTAVNAVSTRAGANVNNLASLFKVGGVIGLIVVCFGSGKADFSHFSPLIADDFSLVFVLAICNALVSSLWAYDGWYQVGNIAGELDEPDRQVPRALFLGLSIVCVLYTLVSIAYLTILTPGQVAASKAVAADTAFAVMGTLGRTLISAAAVVATFGCVNGMILAGPRVYYAMARDGVLPAFLGAAHPRFLTPFWPVILQGIWAALLVLQGDYEELLNYVMFTSWLFYALAGLALMIDRRRNPDTRCYRAWGYPWTTGGFVTVSLVLLVSTFYNYNRESLAGCKLMLAGAVVYLIRRASR